MTIPRPGIRILTGIISMLSTGREAGNKGRLYRRAVKGRLDLAGARSGQGIALSDASAHH
jgi:hypothetical protein